MTTRQNTDYGFDVQKLYLEMMIQDPTTWVRCQSIYDPTLFDTRLQLPARFIQDYTKDHNVLPTLEIINSATKSSLKSPGILHEEHFDWLLLEFETFIKHKGLERAIIQAADLLEQGNYGPVEDMIKQAVQIGLTKDLGIDYWENPKIRLLKIKEQNGQVKTGWTRVDDLLYGGMNRGELAVFVGPSGSGKSLFLANLGVNWALQGLNVLYLTFELSEGLIAMRIDAMITEMSTNQLFKNLDDVDLKLKIISKKAGHYQIKYLPAGMNCNDIRAYVKELEIKSDHKIDVILVDYLDLMMPINNKISPENLGIKDKYVSEELRNLSMELKTVLVTASQTTKDAVEETEYSHAHAAGGAGKIRTADNVFGIFTNRTLRERGKYQLQLMKARNSNGVGNMIELDYDNNTMRISNSSDPDSTYDNPLTTLESLKRKSDNTPKSTTTSAKLKNFLNEIS